MFNSYLCLSDVIHQELPDIAKTKVWLLPSIHLTELLKQQLFLPTTTIFFSSAIYQIKNENYIVVDVIRNYYIVFSSLVEFQMVAPHLLIDLPYIIQEQPILYLQYLTALPPGFINFSEWKTYQEVIYSHLTKMIEQECHGQVWYNARGEYLVVDTTYTQLFSSLQDWRVFYEGLIYLDNLLDEIDTEINIE